MGWFSDKTSLAAMKEALSEAATKVTATVSSIDLKETALSVKDVAVSAAEKTKDASISAYSVTREKTVSTYSVVSDGVRNFDYAELRRAEYYKDTFTEYKDIGFTKVSAYFRSTFEVEKSTMEMVEGIRSSLPVPAQTLDDIFEQCKREAMRRAIASFALGGVMQNIDSHSASKYENLSESYTAFSERTGNAMFDDPNFAAMKDTRYDAQKNWKQLENGYYKDESLDPFGTDIEHVVARKDYYEDLLLRAGTTDDDFFTLINSKENLVFADASLNRSLQDKNIYKYLADNGTPHADDPDLIDVEIKRSGRVVTVRKSDIDEAFNRAEENRSHHRLQAAKEIGTTVVFTGASMAAQQVVGLIVLETIDIFVDEIRDFTVNGRVLNEDGWLQNTKDATTRIQQRLNERFEERQIWARARSLGLEAGVAGALSVIPQILISLIIKMPAFVLALVRECTLSLVRCIRILLSKETSKLDAITIVLAGTASAIVGVYVGRVISNAMAGVPLLNNFNSQISSVLTGVLVTAVPLAAIYTFDQNKNKLTFVTSRFAKSRDADEAVPT
ncbi:MULTISPECIES: hypothetical protein [Pseudomonas]|uniref:hypothetical protein n=1 Tax=Pseudomonas TaxID=286 RepID=UPI001BCE97C6|nr:MULTISPECIES: hypothetical protein [Pseudomonas]MBS7600572.1 hypothetical protein [Pseudomonas sp. RC2C2]UVL26329.1 hypothetical protein LOY30_10225 [Pseudomonas donghuensis]